MKKPNISLYNRRSKKFSHIGRYKSASSLVRVCLSFFMNWNNICFFPFKWKIPLSKHDLKIISRGLLIDVPHICNIQISNILNIPCAFTESKFWMIFKMSSLEKVILDQRWQTRICFRQEFRRQTAAVMICNALINKKWIK